MTNEELAEKIGIGGNDELLPVLWEQTRLFFKFYSEKYYRRLRDKCDNAGVVSEDLIQECYFAMLDGIKAYCKKREEQPDNKFLSYCRFHIRTRFAQMLGYRGRRDPINSEKFSLNEAVPNGDDESDTWLDVLEDPEAERPFRDFEDHSFYRAARKFIREKLKGGGTHDYEIIDYRYFHGWSYKEIACVLNLSNERVRQIEKDALQRLRECYDFRQLTLYNPYRHVGLENFKHNGSVEEQIIERKDLDHWRNSILENILKKE